MYDVVIIGAGITGAMTARKLSQYKLNICILDKENDVACGATKANSAIVHAGFDAEPGTLKAKFNVKGSEMMPEICRELGVKYKQNGSLVLGFSHEDRKHIELLSERGIKNGVKGLKIIERDELKALEPNISDAAKFALYAPTGAIVCPYELAIAAIGNAMDNGADLKLNFAVCGIEYENGIYNITDGNEVISARFVVNASGVYSDKTANMAGDNSFTVTPRRGEYVLLDKECGKTVSCTIFRTPTKMGKGILVTPTVDGNLLIGPTSEDIDDKENTSTTADGLAKVIGQSREYAENIMYNKVITSFCGLRAVGSTHDFIISRYGKGFINAAGIESPGLTSSPAIADYIAELLAKAGLKQDKKDNFDPIRRPLHFFRDASDREKNDIIKKDPSFGRIVCRCEEITEGEILYAIRQNPKPTDLDGVKRRTRSQMGRCQGGFCSPHIIEILASELGTDYLDITKSGSGSSINIGKTKEGNI